MNHDPTKRIHNQIHHFILPMFSFLYFALLAYLLCLHLYRVQAVDELVSSEYSLPHASREANLRGSRLNNSEKLPASLIETSVEVPPQTSKHSLQVLFQHKSLHAHTHNKRASHLQKSATETTEENDGASLSSSDNVEPDISSAPLPKIFNYVVPIKLQPSITDI
jgi:hypothetical protein